MEKNKTNSQQTLTEEQAICRDMLRVFYDRQSPLSDDTGKPFTAPHDGSLGLLALGHIGLIEWRKSRNKHLHEKAKTAKEKSED